MTVGKEWGDREHIDEEWVLSDAGLVATMRINVLHLETAADGTWAVTDTANTYMHEGKADSWDAAQEAAIKKGLSMLRQDRAVLEKLLRRYR